MDREVELAELVALYAILLNRAAAVAAQYIETTPDESDS